MDIQRIDASLVRIQPGTDVAPLAVRLALGERLTATVTGQLADGGVLLDLKGHAIRARSSLPLSPGQRLEVEVAGLGPEIALRVLTGQAIVSERHLALGALAVAGATPSASPPPDVGALLRALEAEVATLTPAQRAEMARLLGPLRADSATTALAAELKHVLENGGLLFESRLREWLQAAGPRPQAASTLPPELASDLKVLLGLLGKALSARGGNDPTAAPSGQAAPGHPTVPGERAAPDSLQRRATDLVRRELEAVRQGDGSALDTLRTEHARTRDELLARQVETAYHWVRDGTLSLHLPLAFDGHVVHAWLRFRRGGGEDREGSGSPSVPFTFDVALDPPGLGPLRARVAWSGRHLRVDFFVAGDAAAAVIAPALPSLSAALLGSGFATVDAAVAVDADRCRLDPPAVMTPPPAGSILNLQA